MIEIVAISIQPYTALSLQTYNRGTRDNDPNNAIQKVDTRTDPARLTTSHAASVTCQLRYEWRDPILPGTTPLDDLF